MADGRVKLKLALWLGHSGQRGLEGTVPISIKAWWCSISVIRWRIKLLKPKYNMGVATSKWNGRPLKLQRLLDAHKHELIEHSTGKYVGSESPTKTRRKQERKEKAI